MTEKSYLKAKYNRSDECIIFFEDLISEFKKVRDKTSELFHPLKIEDAVVQSDIFGSPPNWHLAHVSWFFQKVLEKHGQGIGAEPNDPSNRNSKWSRISCYNSNRRSHYLNLEYLNSYYQRYGNILPKPERGRFPRPTVQQTLEYRLLIERNVISFLKEKMKEEREIIDKEGSSPMSSLVELKYDFLLGNQHEMQHQELMIYDLQNYFQRFQDPNDNYMPVKIIRNEPQVRNDRHPGIGKNPGEGELKKMVKIPGGIYELGFNGHGPFCYDNELPEHKVYLQPYEIDLTPVSNGEFIDFIEDDGYHDFKYWLSDGWDLVQEHEWEAPLYWEHVNEYGRSARHDNDKVRSNSNSGSELGNWIKKDFRGIHEINISEPVVNISYYEADAYARWARKRLPTEAEWEKAASWNEDLQVKTVYPWGDTTPLPKNANLLESYIWGPSIVGSYPEGKSYYGCYQMIGDVWEWTSSEYTLYPGFKPKFSEYTDKWAINQKVLRGGSFATPTNQIRNSYRNYFKPYERILFSGLRCAKNT